MRKIPGGHEAIRTEHDQLMASENETMASDQKLRVRVTLEMRAFPSHDGRGRGKARRVNERPSFGNN